MHPYEPHKVWCSAFKGHMGCLSEVQSVIRSFPWGRVEQDGTFFDNLARARFKLLGGAGFGFSSQNGVGLFQDDEDDQWIKDRKMENPAAWARWEKRKEEQKKIKFVNGQDLLKDKHLTDNEGWKLSAEQVVHRDFLGAQPPRRRRSLLRNWDDWHSWRKVPKSSPASLLMHYPLSIYWMLTETLKVATIGPKESRVRLTVHYIGAEVELNFIPIFAEIALLLPQHDVDLILFGPCVYYLGREGVKSEHQSSLIGRSAHDSHVPIFTYDAPDACGSGSLRVLAHTATKDWSISGMATYGPKPDAIVACNAGLFTYDGSLEVVLAALAHKIPFAVTDYQQYMLESCASTISKTFTHGTLPPVELNPFHKPGQRDCRRSVLAPSLENGFILAVSV
ncbi:hypothetical protein DFH06DRAFT_1466480 [Mycena polygramma]|nr:hypothetical protein DFH06DRAFT_1466480 [Mycena polygramma]